MKIGLYFGSFNPIHLGHLIIASHVANHTDVDKVWMMVSPQNPLKHSSSLLNEYHRLHLVNLAVEGDPQLVASDFEFKLPKPSYTIDTLTFLKEKYPQHHFCIIIGSDSFQNISKWKNHEILLRDFEIYIYKRPGYHVEPNSLNIKTLNAPLLEISSTQIRKSVASGESIRYIVPEKVREEIERNAYYQKL